MRKLFLTLAAVCAFSAAWAAGLSLKGERRVSLAINWSEASILGYTDKEIITYEKDWDKDQVSLLEKMTKTYNKKMGETLPAVLNVQSNYVVELRPLTVNKKGDMTCYAVIKDAQGNVVETLPNFRVEGGHCGTFLNLVGDGMTAAGTQLAKRVKKML